MKKLSMGLCMSMLLLLTACDIKNDYNKPKTEVRTMIIGGMPVHDHDYKTARLSALDTQSPTRE